ncbi:MAG: HlyD family efflux transporter periplasmic adaptor subunit [Patescibacteria group bacterium]
MFLSSLSKHKWITAAAAVAIIGGYFAYRSYAIPAETVRYLTAPAERGTLIVSLTGSGQVAASNQVDLKPKTSGDVTFVGVVDGQSVKAGALVVQLDSRDAQKAVRDAEVSLETAKLSLDKLKQPPDALSILQAENSLTQAKEAKDKAVSNLASAYDDGFTTISNAFLDLPTLVTGLHDILFSNTINTNQANVDYYSDSVSKYDQKSLAYARDADDAYQKARSAYDANFTAYKNTERTSSVAAIESLLKQTRDTTLLISSAVKSADNLIQFYKDTLTGRGLPYKTAADAHLTGLSSYTGKATSQFTNLQSAVDALKNDRDAITSADRSVGERTESLAKLKAAPSALDLRSAELSIKQREYSLLDVKEKLADYFIRAPFDGVIAKVGIKKGDSASSGTSVATLITAQKLAQVSLNEVDVAKVKVGQKATLSFDAVSDLQISGQVAQVDALGAVSQGVVTYGVTIAFDTQDLRIKPGMSVSAAIITDVKQDVLMVPNSAIKAAKPSPVRAETMTARG